MIHNLRMYVKRQQASWMCSGTGCFICSPSIQSKAQLCLWKHQQAPTVNHSHLSVTYSRLAKPFAYALNALMNEVVTAVRHHSMPTGYKNSKASPDEEKERRSTLKWLTGKVGDVRQLPTAQRNFNEHVIGLLQHAIGTIWQIPTAWHLVESTSSTTKPWNCTPYRAGP